jgi:hypothetical protein
MICDVGVLRRIASDKKLRVVPETPSLGVLLVMQYQAIKTSVKTCVSYVTLNATELCVEEKEPFNSVMRDD